MTYLIGSTVDFRSEDSVIHSYKWVKEIMYVYRDYNIYLHIYIDGFILPSEGSLACL